MESPAYRSTERTFSFGPFKLIPTRQLLLRDRVPIQLGSRALDILTTLVERTGELVSKDELIAAAWPNVFVQESNLKVNMWRLRRSLGDTQKDPTYVATVAGRGYRFVAPVEMSISETADQSVALSVGEPSGLPPLREIVGRDQEIANIIADLRDKQHITVVGAGGIGKTTVAVAAAQRFAAQCRDGACFVDLSTFEDPTLLPSALIAALRIRDNSGDMLKAVLRHLAQRNMLVLLDNCEHVLPAVSIFARRFSAGTGNSRLLVTSREPLGTFAEHTVRLDTLAFPQARSPLTVEEAMTYPAVDLFARRAAEWAGYQLADSDCPTVAHICGALDGLPLAIELAAAKMEGHTAQELSAMLDEHLSFQKRRADGGPSRHESLLATIDWSFQLLSKNEATILLLLSAFADGFELDDVATVADAIALHPIDVTISLGGLAAKSLVAAEVRGAGVRYRLLDSTRRYATERLKKLNSVPLRSQRGADHVVAAEQVGSDDEFGFAKGPSVSWRKVRIWETAEAVRRVIGDAG
jgi:predicted ATPase/DNA-binding winged helix-turn-helix (wHTH) protein